MENTILLKIHKIDADGKVESMRLETNPLEDTVTTTVITEDNIHFDKRGINWDYILDNKNTASYSFVEPKSPTITLIKIGGVDELNPLHYATQIGPENNTGNDKSLYVFTEIATPKRKCLVIPEATSAIKCQNCENVFATKYQYQRHQCEFNADKVVLKSNVAGKDLDKATRIKYECDQCTKSFISKNNLERHLSSHDTSKENLCEHCNKKFVSENRLRIHKENHCKKAGDTLKYYKSDMAVWKCLKCKQVFATEQGGKEHAISCTGFTSTKVEETNINRTDSPTEETSENDNTSTKIFEINLEKTVTENLYQCEFCNRTFSDKESLLDHQKMHTTNKNYECVFCHDSFDGYVQATVHWQNTCHRESVLFYLPKMVLCDYCEKSFKSHEILYTHKNKKKHFMPKMSTKVTEKSKSDLNVSCNKTETLPANNAIVKLIEDVMHMKPTILQKNAECENNDNALLPIKLEAGDVQNLNIKTEESESDINPETGKKKRGRKRKNKTNVKIKKTLKLEDGYKYQCERCGVAVDDATALDDHKESVHASTFSCEECGQVVHSSKALMIHCRAHQCLKPYVCEQCGRSYSQTSHLWQHMRFHQGIKPFACPHEGCEARYTIRPDLKDHIRKVHTRERPFKCSVCQKCFLTGSVYYQHRLIHTNDRRYGCDICAKRFFRADALNNHRRIHTDERPYPCPVCGREFRQKGDRNKHVRTQHPSD